MLLYCFIGVIFSTLLSVQVGMTKGLTSKLLWFKLKPITVHALLLANRRCCVKVAWLNHVSLLFDKILYVDCVWPKGYRVLFTEVSRLLKQPQVSLVSGKNWRKISAFCFHWSLVGLLVLFLDTECCKWLFLHVSTLVHNWAWSFIPLCVLQATF